MIDEKKFKRLPKWAQAELKTLKSNLQRAENELAELYGKKETNVNIRELGKNKPLPKDAVIEYTLKDGIKLSCHIDGDNLRVYGKEAIVIIPMAANSCYIKKA